MKIHYLTNKEWRDMESNYPKRIVKVTYLPIWFVDKDVQKYVKSVRMFKTSVDTFVIYREYETCGWKHKDLYPQLKPDQKYGVKLMQVNTY